MIIILLTILALRLKLVHDDGILMDSQIDLMQLHVGGDSHSTFRHNVGSVLFCMLQ